MIYFDTTKTSTSGHRSGLMRVTSRLLEEFGSSVTAVVWDTRQNNFAIIDRQRLSVEWRETDWLLTAELFSEGERPGFREFLRRRPCRLAAIVHDAIPLRWPLITWPQSVQRHPEYMKMLAGFDRVWAVSETTRQDFIGFWRWQEVAVRAEAQVIALGADFDGASRVQRDPVIPLGRPGLLCVGIVEPRKNQGLLLDAAEALWREGIDFELTVVGRVNPNFGRPWVTRMRDLQTRETRFRFQAAAGDRELARLYAMARAVVFPTRAEGCGLPLREALWRGVPCVCSDLPVLRENAPDQDGCLWARVDDLGDWTTKLRVVLSDSTEVRRLQAGAMTRPLNRWSETAQTLLRALRPTSA